MSFDIGKQDEVKTKKIFNLIADRCRPWRQVQKNFYLSTSIKLERQIHIILFKNVGKLKVDSLEVRLVGPIVSPVFQNKLNTM